MSGHKHAAEMLQYAEDAAVMEKPWENWEYRLAGGGVWFEQQSHPRWAFGTEYRRRPRTTLGNAQVIAVGNAVDGLTFIGPFPDHEAAVEYAEGLLNKDWVIAELDQPQES